MLVSVSEVGATSDSIPRIACLLVRSEDNFRLDSEKSLATCPKRGQLRTQIREKPVHVSEERATSDTNPRNPWPRVQRGGNFGLKSEKSLATCPKRGQLRTRFREIPGHVSEESETSDSNLRNPWPRVRRSCNFGLDSEKSLATCPKRGQLWTQIREIPGHVSEESETSDSIPRKACPRVRSGGNFGLESEKSLSTCPKRGQLRTRIRELLVSVSEVGATSDSNPRNPYPRVRRVGNFGQESLKKELSSPKRTQLRTRIGEIPVPVSEEAASSDRIPRKAGHSVQEQMCKKELTH
jgi:hypothetical protein